LAGLIDAAREDKKKNVPVVCIVSAVSKTGKTTLAENIIGEFVRRGLRVGAVKSDCHGFMMDVPGKDSWRFTQAGAVATAVVSEQQFALVQKTSEKKDLDEVISLMGEIDIAVVEGFKLAGKPKIEVVRQERVTRVHSSAEELIAVVTDIDDLGVPVPRFALNDYAKIAGFLVAKYLLCGNASEEKYV